MVKTGLRKSIKNDETMDSFICELKTPAFAQIQAMKYICSLTEGKISQEDQDIVELTLNSCIYEMNLIEIYDLIQKAEFEKISINYEKFNIVELFNQTIQDYKILLKYNKIALELNSQEEIIIQADKAHIKRIIEIFVMFCVENAFKSSKIKVQMYKQKKEFMFKIRVESDKIEIKNPADFFDKTKINSKSHKKISTRHALYVAKELIYAHFGNIILEGYPNHANIIGFCIPI